jgi:hypothetical protein
LAKEQSTAGAKAFVRYTIDALNYGYLAGRSDAFKTVSDSVCAVCSALQSNIDRIERSGGHQVGGDWSPISIDKVPSGVPTEPILIAEVTVAAGWTTPSANAPREKIRPADVFYEFHLHWVADEWQLTDRRGHHVHGCDSVSGQAHRDSGRSGGQDAARPQKPSNV